MERLPFRHITVDAFRGLFHIDLPECRQVNILVGANNSGKTSLLEALMLLANPLDLRQWESAIEFRSGWPLVDLRYRGATVDRLDALTWLFPLRDGARGPISLVARGEAPVSKLFAHVSDIVGDPPDHYVRTERELVEGGWPMRDGSSVKHSRPESQPGLEIEMSLSYESRSNLFREREIAYRFVLWHRGRRSRMPSAAVEGVLNIALASPTSHRSDGYLVSQVGKVLRSSTKKGQIVEMLRHLDPKITDLTIVTPDGSENDGALGPREGRSPTLHIGYEGTGLVPVFAMGDGIRRAVHLASLVAGVGPGGVVLVDEIESGLHTKALKDTFAWLGRMACESRVQLFVTTHSLEAVDAMSVGLTTDDIVLFRLTEGRAKRIDGSALRTARMELGQEVR